jgi:hypothetical protein
MMGLDPELHNLWYAHVTRKPAGCPQEVLEVWPWGRRECNAAREIGADEVSVR